MIQDLAPSSFSNAFELHLPEKGEPLLLYRGKEAILSLRDGEIVLPRLGDYPGIRAEDCRFAFRIDGKAYALSLLPPEEIPEGYSLYPSSEYRHFAPRKELFACAAGHSLFRWYRENRYCGSCGAKLQDADRERALVCPSCGSIHYPKICPAVIVALRDGEKLLVTRYKDRPFKGLALVAGFAEIGESIEDTVRREVWEETGLKVKNLSFYKSQPWVITDSLLFGFFCDLEGPNEICLEEDELSYGEWIDRRDLPPDESHVSLTAEMMECFRRGQDRK